MTSICPETARERSERPDVASANVSTSLARTPVLIRSTINPKASTQQP
jgi:hypothetical protein